MEKEKDELFRERSYDDDDDDDDDDDNDDDDDKNDNDEVATGASWKSVPEENMECPHLSQSVRFGDDNVDGSGYAVKDLPFVCAGRDSSYKAPEKCLLFHASLSARREREREREKEREH